MLKPDPDARPMSPLQLVATLSAFTLVYLALLIVWRSYGAAHDIVHPPIEPITDTPARHGVTALDVPFRAADGVKLRGWYIPPTMPEGAVILVAAGHGETRTDMITTTLMLAKHGYGVLTWDWRATGESDGERVTLGYDEVNDVQAAVDWLRRRAEVPDQQELDPERIGALSQSAGAAAMIMEAAGDPGIKALVAETPFATLSDMLETGLTQKTGLPSFPFFGLIVFFGQLQSGVNIQAVRPVDHIAKLAPRPFLIIRAGRDLWVPPNNADLLFEAAGEPKELWDAPLALHSEVEVAYPEEYEARVVGFFDKALKQK